MPDVALVTCQTMAAMDHESKTLIEHLNARGVTTAHWAWDDPSIDWSTTSLAVIRSTWDYTFHVDAFSKWLSQVDSATRIANSTALVRWNMDKHYLAKLEARGLPIVPTHYVEPHDECDLAALLDTWPRVIIKPAISVGAYDTIQVSINTLDQGQAHLAEHAHRSMMIQPMMEKILTQGERSQIYFRGALSHVVDKTPKAGDFRIQEHYGGTYTAASPRPSDLTLSRAVMDALDAVPLFARVDSVDDDAGQPRLMEVELIEPDLYLRHVEGGYERLADAIVNQVNTTT